MHPWHDIDPGKAELFTSIVEIPLGSSNKYELDKFSGLLKLDRVLYSAVYYPANYGFIPRTLADDNDPLDVLILSSDSVYPMTMVTAKPIGVMTMTDQNELDYKIIAVGYNDPEYKSYDDIHDLPSHRLAVIKRFFQDYKTLENKTVEVDDFFPASKAITIINTAFTMYNNQLGS